jgi:uncharacterized LabA/DUF88 family protein
MSLGSRISQSHQEKRTTAIIFGITKGRVMARMITKTRITLEEDILKLWNIKEDLETFLQMYCDNPQPMTEDQVYNYLHSISNVLDLRMERLWDTFCQCFELDEYANEEAIAARIKMWQDSQKQEKPKKKGKKT